MQRWRTSGDVGEWDRRGSRDRGGGRSRLLRPPPPGGGIVRRGRRLRRRHTSGIVALATILRLRYTFVILAAGSPDRRRLAAEVLAHARLEDIQEAHGRGSARTARRVGRREVPHAAGSGRDCYSSGEEEGHRRAPHSGSAAFEFQGL